MVVGQPVSCLGSFNAKYTVATTTTTTEIEGEGKHGRVRQKSFDLNSKCRYGSFTWRLAKKLMTEVRTTIRYYRAFNTARRRASEKLPLALSVFFLFFAYDLKSCLFMKTLDVVGLLGEHCSWEDDGGNSRSSIDGISSPSATSVGELAVYRRARRVATTPSL